MAGCWLENIRLEYGFITESSGLQRTLTSFYDIWIEGGKIERILPHKQKEKESHLAKGTVIDGKGLLMTAALVEKHCHIDKTFLGDRWQANIVATNVQERSDYEKSVIPFMTHSTMEERSRALIDLFIKQGSGSIRTHIDIYPEVGIGQMKSVQSTLDSYRDSIDYEIVAFPQHGLLRSRSIPLIEEALKMGAHLVGGVDPTALDGDMKKSLHATFELAVKYNVGIDYHLHERGDMGMAAIEEIIKFAKESHFDNRIWISHGFALGDIHGEQRAEIAEQMKALGIGIISHVPIDGRVPDLDYYYENGVTVALGSDNIFDSWSPLGDGSLRSRLLRLTEIFRHRTTEIGLATGLNMITDYNASLTKEGKRHWPMEGNKANFILTDASCGAEFLARQRDIKALYHNGKEVY